MTQARQAWPWRQPRSKVGVANLKTTLPTPHTSHKQASLALEARLALPNLEPSCQRHTTKQQMEPWKKRSWRCQLKNGVANATQESLARHQILVPTRLPNAQWRTNQRSKRPLAHHSRCQRWMGVANAKTRQPEHVHFNGRYLELQRSKLSTSSCVGKLTFRAFQ